MLIKKRFELLPHTADAMFRAYGRNCEEAFSNSALALFAIITDVTQVEPTIKREVNVKSKDKEALLYDFLEELIYLTDTEGFLLSKVQELSINKDYAGINLRAVILGDSAGKYDVVSAIKAMTYNEMKIVHEPDFVMIQAVPDL